MQSEDGELDRKIDLFEQLFKKYRELTAGKKTAEEAKIDKNRFPTGKTIKIKKQEFSNSLDTVKSSMVLDDAKSKEAAEKEINDYLSSITSMDDLLEEDGKIIGLKVYNSGDLK
jgi:hypothetical protein